MLYQQVVLYEQVVPYQQLARGHDGAPHAPPRRSRHWARAIVCGLLVTLLLDLDAPGALGVEVGPALRQAKDRLYAKLGNFRVEGVEESETTYPGGYVWVSEKALFVVRADDEFCVRMRNQSSTLEGLDTIREGDWDQTQLTESHRNSETGVTSIFFFEDVRCWPFCAESPPVDSIVHSLPRENDFAGRAPWGDLLLGEMISDLDFVSGLSIEDVLGLGEEDAFKRISDEQSADGMNIRLASDDWGQVDVKLVRSIDQWDLKSIHRRVSKTQFIGRDRRGKKLLAESNPYFQLKSGEGVDQYDVLYEFDISDETLNITKRTNHRVGEQKLRFDRKFQSRVASFGNESAESVLASATKLPEGKKVLPEEPERKRAGWLVENGVVTMDKGPLGDLSEVTFTPARGRFRSLLLFLNAILVLGACGFYFYRKRLA